MDKVIIDDVIIDFQNPSRQENEKSIVLGMLVSYIKCFLDNTTFHGNELQSMRVIKKMFTFRHGLRMRGNIIQFKFPENLRRQFLLSSNYRIPLTRAGVSEFYIRKLMPQSKLACNISVHTSGKEERLTINRIQKLILISQKHLKNVTITCENGKYVCVIESRLSGVSKIILPAKETLVDAVYALQEELIERENNS